MKRYLLLLIPICGLGLLNACGGSSGSPPPLHVATHLLVTTSATATVGADFGVTVSTLDASNNVASTYQGTVHFSSTDSQAVLPPDSIVEGGNEIFSVKFKTAGSQSITVTSAMGSLTPASSGSITVVTSPAATHFSLSTPASAAAGTAFKFTVTALDASNTLSPSYSGTVHFTSTDALAVLPLNATLTSGTATFSATLKTAGSQTVTGTDTATASVTGNSKISVSALGVLTITSFPPPGGTVGAVYGGFYPCGGPIPPAFRGFQFTASGGTAPYSWSAGGLPPGLTINGPYCAPAGTRVAGAIGGTPTAAGSYNVTVTVTDSGSPAAHASASYTIIINAAQAAANATAALASASELSSEKAHAKHHMYKLIDLGTFGGPNSSINCCAGVQPNLSQRGAVVGGADTSIPNPHGANPNPLLCCEIFVNPAFKWQDGTLIELGALPGGFNGFAVSVNASGAVVGTAENGETDPLQGYPESHPVLWKDSRTIDLGTFGGYEGLAFAINNRGQVAGFAQNAISDPFGYFGFGTQSRAFLWQDGTLQDLGTLGGNNASSDYLNDSGQVAGHSDTNTTPSPIFGLPTQHPFLWENDRMLDLGTLGGTLGAPNDLNNRGQVVGLASLAGDLAYHPFIWDEGVLRDLGTLGGPSGSANKINDAGQVVGYGDLPGGPCQGLSCVHHAFFWEHAVMTDLGTLPADICSNAVSINRSGLILGYSTPACNSNTLSPVIWENGTIYDLSSLVVPSPGVTLGEMASLNDRGEISGLATLPNGDLHAVLLIPCDAEHANVEGCDYNLVDAADASSKQIAFTESTPSTANGVANPMAQNEAMRARLAHWHHQPSFGPNN